MLHIAERHAGLLPDEPDARMRAIAWMFAAVNTLEPPIVELGMARLFERDESWYAQRLPMLEGRARTRLRQLSARLGDAQWLDGAFGAGDLMVASVLLRLQDPGLLAETPNLAAYLARAEARPAYRRAFDAQRAVFEASAPKPDPG